MRNPATRRWALGAALLSLLPLAPLLLALSAPAVAQEPGPPGDENVRHPGEGSALRLMWGHRGVGIGHVPRVTGLRVNWADRALDDVTGVNLTLWRPSGQREGGTVGGRARWVALGTWPQAGRILGLGVGVVGVVGEEGLDGVHLGGMGTVSGDAGLSGVQMAGVATVAGGRGRGVQASGGLVAAGDALTGFQTGGLAVVGRDRMAGAQFGGLAVLSGDGSKGIQAGGLAVVGGESMRGVQAGGLATISGEELRGVQGSGLAVVGGERVEGIQVGGLAVVTGGRGRGVQAGGLAVVAGDSLDGIQAGGLGVVAGCGMRGLQASVGSVAIRRDLDDDGRVSPALEEVTLDECPEPEMSGLSVAGIRVRTQEARWVTVAGGWIDADRIKGLSVAGFQRTGLHVGLSVGLVNWSDELRGVQLGLLNRAGNNRSPFRTLPLVNANLRR